jgi:hypothetical protein
MSIILVISVSNWPVGLQLKDRSHSPLVPTQSHVRGTLQRFQGGVGGCGLGDVGGGLEGD